jgi:hypothetical protein
MYLKKIDAIGKHLCQTSLDVFQLVPFAHDYWEWEAHTYEVRFRVWGPLYEKDHYNGEGIISCWNQTLTLIDL